MKSRHAPAKQRRIILMAALQYLKLGWSVIPLIPRSKIPAVPWAEYQCRRMSEAEATQIFSSGDYGVGIVMGAISGIFALDLDTPEALAEAMRHGLPETLWVKTPNGRHYYFRLPAFEVRNRARILPGTDIRGEGGYVAAPISIHPSGVEYRWFGGLPQTNTCKQAPGWLLARMQAPDPTLPGPSHATAALVASSNAAEEELARGIQALEGAAPGTRNDTLNKVAYRLFRISRAGELDEIDVKIELTSVANRIGLNGREVIATLKSAEKAAAIAPPLRIGSRPVIKVVAGNLRQTMDDAEAAILAANEDVYQRGGLIVRPVPIQVVFSEGRDMVAPRLVCACVPYLIEIFTDAALFQRFDKRSGDWQPVDCPKLVAEAYLARAGKWRLPVLSGIVFAPTLRPDGTVLERPGYDAVTGLLFDTQGVTFPRVPECATRDEALSALNRLKGLICTFPFASDADRSVALSAILTALVRRALPSAPLHGFSAPTAGTGKSLLVDLAAMIATGRAAPVIAQGRTEEEMEKRLGAALIAGDALVTLDNCEQPVGGELLCQALTQPVLRLRILGKSVNAEVPSNAAMFATGNNLTLVGDMTRRALLCTLDAGMERPELRRFDFDPIEVARKCRGEYAVAALTILRAYIVAGRPDQGTPLGSFVNWSGLVRNALMWLGEADPCATMQRIRASDPRLAALCAVTAEWGAVLGSRRVSVKDVIDIATAQHSDPATGRPIFSHAGLREALLAVAGEGGAINGRRLGKYLSGMQGRVVDGRKIVADGTAHGAVLWRLDHVAAAPAQNMGLV